MRPPTAERRPHAVEAHGDARVDDWYWLRERDDPGVQALIEAEIAFAEAALAPLKRLEDEIYHQAVARLQPNDVSATVPYGPWAYYERRRDGLEHAIRCRRPIGSPAPDPDASPGADPAETVILDENALASQHPYWWLANTALSPSQRFVAYAADTTGGELMTVRIRDVDAGADLDDRVEGAGPDLAFAGEGHLFYSKVDDAMRPYQVWRHRLGAPAGSDELVAEEGNERFELSVAATKDAQYVVITSESTGTSESWLVPASDPTAEPVTVLGRHAGVKYEVEHHHGVLVMLTNSGGHNFSLVSAPVEAPGDQTTLLEHRDDVRLESVDVVDGYAIVAERGHGTTWVRVIGLGWERGAYLLEAPEAGVVVLAGNLDFDAGEVHYTTATLVDPPITWAADLTTGAAREVHRLRVPGYDAGNYRTARVEVVSDDVAIPVTLAWRADRPDGPGPCLLYGYGAYESSSDPFFEPDWPILPVLDRGGMFAIAHVRGGGERGRSWYLDGRLDKKPNTFKDFVAVARWLVDAGHTTPAQLAAEGLSAGGLLMGAVANLAPELFGAILAEVPWVDVVTTMLDPTIPLSVPEQEEWGDPIHDPAAYEYMKAYSPYDNIRPVVYPRMLVTTGLNDPRVMFFEPLKWVQKLRAAHPDNAGRVVLKISVDSGHHGPLGRYAEIRQRASVLAFVLDAVGAGGGEVGGAR